LGLTSRRKSSPCLSRGTLTVTLSQVSNNTASGIGGGIVENGVNPDFTIGAPGGPLTLKLSTVTGNTAAQGGGIFASSGSPVALKLTLVARNVPDNCFPLGSIANCKN
jgi:predicted outer membrane repeat protein